MQLVVQGSCEQTSSLYNMLLASALRCLLALAYQFLKVGVPISKCQVDHTKKGNSNFDSQFSKHINNSCVQQPTGLQNLGHMNACGWIASETLEPVFRRVFIWGITERGIFLPNSCAR